MGHASSIAMGLAAAQCSRRRIFCIDGDGSVIMHMGSLAVIGQKGTSNLIHIVINNGAHDSVGGQPTVGFDIDLVTVARACGYKKVICISTSEMMIEFLNHISDDEGPVFMEVLVNKGFRTDLGRPKITPVDNKNLLMRSLER